MLAGQELRGLLHEGLIEQHGVSRWTYYTLKIGNEQQTEQQRAEPTDEERILAHVREHGSISNAECRDLLGVKLQRASYLLKKMARDGQLKREGVRRWTRYQLP
jgi:predicted HTH transcriptional regulator